MSYSTCSNDRLTCPDGICDSLELMSVFTICPQDCIPKSKLPMLIQYKVNNSWTRGIGVLRSSDKNMVCTCQGKQCSCIHESYSHSPDPPDEILSEIPIKGKILYTI